MPRPRPGDLVAGLSVALVLIPQSLAYADLAGLPPVHGLFAAALPPIVAALVASSPFLQTGPVAMTSLLTFGALSSVATPGSADYVGMAALLALIVGTIRVLIGFLGMGAIGYLMSRPVLVGFTSGAVILIIASQIPTALGVSPPEGHLLFQAAWSSSQVKSLSFQAIGLTLGTMALVAMAPRIHPLVPGVVIAIAAGVALSQVAWFTGETLGDLPAALPRFSLSLPWSRIPKLLLPGAVIALVGFAEASAIGRAFADPNRRRWNPDREFIGQGLANVAAGISGGFPVGGSLSRSSLNRACGARTTWSGMASGVFVLAFLPAASILEGLPRPVLAGIVIATVIRLVRPGAVIELFRCSVPQGGVAVATFGFTLLLSPHIEQAVVFGVGISIMTHLVRENRLFLREYHDADGSLRLEVSGVLYFGSAHLLADRVAEAISGDVPMQRLVIDLAGVGRLDYTAVETLNRIAEQAKAVGIETSLANVSPRIRKMVDRAWRNGSTDDHG